MIWPGHRSPAGGSDRPRLILRRSGCRRVSVVFLSRPFPLQSGPLRLPCRYALSQVLVGVLGHVAEALNLDRLQLELQIENLHLVLVPFVFSGPGSVEGPTHFLRG